MYVFGFFKKLIKYTGASIYGEKRTNLREVRTFLGIVNGITNEDCYQSMLNLNCGSAVLLSSYNQNFGPNCLLKLLENTAFLRNI